MFQMKIEGQEIKLKDCEAEPLIYPDLVSGLSEQAKITVHGICATSGEPKTYTFTWPVKRQSIFA